MLNTFRNAVLRARQQQDLYFSTLLDEETINGAFGSARHLWQGWVYTPGNQHGDTANTVRHDECIGAVGLASEILG